MYDETPDTIVGVLDTKALLLEAGSTWEKMEALKAKLAEDGWIPVDPATVETRFPGVYAIGDVAKIGAPKSGL